MIYNYTNLEFAIRNLPLKKSEDRQVIENLASSNLISSSNPFNKRAAEMETRPSKSAFLPTKKHVFNASGFLKKKTWGKLG